MTQMRKLIARHMIESRRTSAHVHCMYEVDFTRIVNLRARQKAGFEQRHGVRLTFMPFFVRAAIIAIQQWPIVNAVIEGENIRYHRNINLGIAVALDWGLIVPVLKNAGDLNFLGLQRGITDLGERARTKRSNRRRSRVPPSPSPIPACSAPCSACPSSISPSAPSWGSVASQAARCHRRPRRQRHHRHPLRRPPHPRLRPPRDRRRGRRPVHGPGQKESRNLERGSRLVGQLAGRRNMGAHL